LTPILKIGKILDGEYKDWLITIEPLPKYGSHLVISWNVEGTQGYDNHYFTFDDAKEYLSKFNIEWTDEDYVI